MIMADPPCRPLTGSHDTNEALHSALLERARTVAAPRARLAVLTHGIRITERCLRRASRLWSEHQVARVFQQGLPRINLLIRN